MEKWYVSGKRSSYHIERDSGNNRGDKVAVVSNQQLLQKEVAIFIAAAPDVFDAAKAFLANQNETTRLRLSNALYEASNDRNLGIGNNI